MMKNWIQKVVDQHAEMESPRNFWYWGAMATISAIVKDQIWLDRGGAYKLYPNIYVMLHADSGLKKGPPVSLAKHIVRKVNNTRIISGRSSIQGILKELGTAYTIPGGKVMNKSVGFIVASEFSSAIVNDPAAMTILTDLYDRQYNEGEYKSLLKMESFELRDPTITLLVATNEAHFEDFVAKKDIQGGFIGRMFVIAESEVNTFNSLIAPLSNPPNVNELAEYPKELAKISGPFAPLAHTEKTDIYHIKKVKHERELYYTIAGDLYDEWYDSFYQSIKDQRVKDETGTIQRIGDSVLKVAMLLSLSTEPNLIISKDNIEEAIRVCEQLIGNIRKTTMGKKSVAKDDDATRKVLLIRELIQREDHRVSRAMFAKKYWADFNHDDLDRVSQSLHDSAIIQIQSVGNQVIFTMSEAEAQRLEKHFKGK